MESKSGSLRGDLIKWAREEQRLTMRWVADHGGPCLGYQSEVENQKKAEVRWDKLTTWIKALNITEPFVRGNIPRYNDEPTVCRGLAADVGQLIRDGSENWSALSYSERSRQVLCLISRESQKLPRVVLAHTLGLELQALDAYMSGQLAFLPHVVKALSDLTALPDSFFTHGILMEETQADYAEAVEVARQHRLSPEDLIRLIKGAAAAPGRLS